MISCLIFESLSKPLILLYHLILFNISQLIKNNCDIKISYLPSCTQKNEIEFWHCRVGFSKAIATKKSSPLPYDDVNLPILWFCFGQRCALGRDVMRCNLRISFKWDGVGFWIVFWQTGKNHPVLLQVGPECVINLNPRETEPEGYR